MITLYGISNCDTIRKAKKWLETQGIEYQFHDFRKQGLDAERLNAWVQELGWEALLNKRGTTWRQLPDEAKADLDPQRAQQLMREHPALIKRPVLDLGERRELGFDADRYATRLPQAQR